MQTRANYKAFKSNFINTIKEAVKNIQSGVPQFYGWVSIFHDFIWGFGIFWRVKDHFQVFFSVSRPFL